MSFTTKTSASVVLDLESRSDPVRPRNTDFKNVASSVRRSCSWSYHSSNASFSLSS